MKKIPADSLLFTSVVIATCIVVATGSAPAAASDTAYGQPLNDLDVVRIAQLLEEPERYVDRGVRVEGLVEDVCPMKGCWIDVLESDSQQTIRFKVQDDVIVFPAQAKGQQVVAEGVLRKHEMTREQAVSWLAHLAEEEGEPFDESSVEGPLTFYQIEGRGAVVRAAE